ncbi:hypothetical protein R3P38DRAFT_3346719 [Favolaschia claudopus]|uniref:Uncharacterized protein n=1 Tax=Favolaschia claudopus TaxID=2862362 RepID=A0AAW0D7T1_9AGAR
MNNKYTARGNLGRESASMHFGRWLLLPHIPHISHLSHISIVPKVSNNPSVRRVYPTGKFTNAPPKLKVYLPNQKANLEAAARVRPLSQHSVRQALSPDLRISTQNSSRRNEVLTRLNNVNLSNTDRDRLGDLRAAHNDTLSPFTAFRNQTPDNTASIDGNTEKIAEPGDQEQDRIPRSPPPDPNVDLEAQLQAAREENGILVARINEMETNSDPVLGWGRGDGEEPPPEYTGRGINA